MGRHGKVRLCAGISSPDQDAKDSADDACESDADQDVALGAQLYDLLFGITGLLHDLFDEVSEFDFGGFEHFDLLLVCGTFRVDAQELLQVLGRHLHDGSAVRSLYLRYLAVHEEWN